MQQEFKHLLEKVKEYQKVKELVNEMENAIWSIRVPVQGVSYEFGIDEENYVIKTVGGQIAIYKKNGVEISLVDFVDDPQKIRKIVNTVLYYASCIADIMSQKLDNLNDIKAIASAIIEEVNKCK
ncbi:MAG: hypothetical protein ABC536_07055, partial [Candidatus Methanosuratincola petrocarbonis]